ncbi:ABC-type sugar transport system, periplasmic component [Sanguibacter keddieii DSM 10542]|uniref:ABC-type sugar transport system, periplasmic component n=1 Tax=Sanguibacter keddieii (strain ATCC 51767 / DSM 10542 / NCFB 3025 / ST-74) TaxID=446469 RepID=D1BI78_SANKS|nr:extracellular solute-binding protein [Sanguibacter keddieii]ACZ20052.1 ABC-type sugar transport system, periplasmic component [Sanguibacter keddieii DSM 10542]
MHKLTRAGTLSASVAVSLALAGCAGDGDEAATDGRIDLDFWYSVSGVPADILTELVDDFNEAHPDISVNAVYQGSYSESMSKLTNAVQSGDLPQLVQGGDTFSTYLQDTGLTIAPGEVTASDGTVFDEDDVVPVIASYYTSDDVLTSVPIMVSQPVVLYNQALLESAGIDPASPPASLSELFSTAESVHAQTGTAGLTKFLDPWWAEQFTAAEGLQYCTPDNGTAAPASAFSYTAAPQVAVWEKIQELVSSGVMLNTGTDGSASLNAFAAGEAALMIQSSRIFGDAERAADFEFGAWPLPVGSADGGAVPGGNSVWMIDDDQSDETLAASATFVQYMASPEVQTKIFLESGYLPTSTTALESLDDVSDMQQVVLDQLAGTTDSVPSAGCHSGAMNEGRDAVRSAIEGIVGGADVTATLKDAEERGNAAIQHYLDRLG